MKRICIYLRKSRADEEAEKRGEGETLSKHRKILQKLAADNKYNVVKLYEEIASGESLSARPKMLELLREVEDGCYDAVLCMDVDRLGRGNMQEQGLILDTFKNSKTRIITPRKLYDLNDEWDEEYSEFEAFMARKELKIINRRLQRGRIRSVEDGNYLGTLPPYGYELSHMGRLRTLVPHPEQAPTVKMIFDMYVNQGLGGSKIAARLNELGSKTYTGKLWTNQAVLGILKNEVYTGSVQWNKTSSTKASGSMQTKKVRKLPRESWINVPGSHEAIISEELFRKAREIMAQKAHSPHSLKLTNPLAGLIKCGVCGSTMVYRTYPKSEPHIMCSGKCGNKSSKFSFVESRLLSGLSEWLKDYNIAWEQSNTAARDNEDVLQAYKKSLKNLENQLRMLESQKLNLHGLLERGVYDASTYVKRSRALSDEIKSLIHGARIIRQEIEEETRRRGAGHHSSPMVQNPLELYTRTRDSSKKNILLKSVLDHAEYIKNRDEKNDQFTLILYPRLPKAHESQLK